ncbi:MAG: 4-hydroxy-2-oxovalerate aldolase [Candidatus Nanopelagicales bacterium]|jgi:4-hydroxy 2-oxovalerate aldolase|nr:4-hydroxy-2-oxovalerate aldolase [Candidatus Nanopelagicales bacterium]MDP4714541.1 4-hydroxy-2-oxovalerate aldolase [Candidatus Nanopelagicales bacterium]MDP4906603.1 4-hydroxy-2-oxovalerate aldolase [Candidatus Nanopelagicales bacterium]MDP4974433.1 4-hydroxy-2-oxovalerate aldolase [Candidatus Nanopelagicales bacterium]
MSVADYRLIDSTLRDGSHAISHQYFAEDVIRIVAGLDAAGVQVIEIAHGDGLGGSSFNYGFSAVSEKELIAQACDTAQTAQIACLLLPGIGLADDLREVRELGVSVARIAVHCTEADITEQHIRVAKDLGMEAIGFLMMAHMNSPEGLVEQALLMQSYGADTIYIADSAGAMTVDDVRHRVSALVGALEVPVGVHAHNNLSMAVANSIAAYEEGARNLDGTSAGLGAGAGNCPTEILAAVSAKYGIETGVDPLALMDVAEDVVRPLMPRQQVIDRAGLLLGYAGVYGSFLLHAERAAQRYGVPQSEIILELGRRKVVGGQEDMIIDVALELARKHAEQEVTP